jgi:two-component system NtrC family sensor kinase
MKRTAPHILLVEDSPTQAMQLQYALDAQGWITTLCTDAESALQQIDVFLPDLLLVDFHLPRMNGDELVRRIRMNMRTRELQVLMLTDSDTLEIERRGFDCGADAYVPKSADPDILLTRINLLLRKAVPVSLAHGPARGFHRSRLLIVDDSPTYRQFLTLELEQDGHEVIAVSSGSEVLLRLETEAFDCIVVDLVMPEMSGTDLCARLDTLRRQQGQLFQIVILTARDTKEDMMLGLEAGADDFVGKASDGEVLKARIRAQLRRKFLHEENLRITGEFRNKEIELARARADAEEAKARADLAEALERSNHDLEAAYRELQETQSQLVHSAKMASLGALVAGIAHEINNPLAFVINHLTTVKRGMDSLLPEIEPHLSEAGTRTLDKVRQRLDAMRLGVDRVEDLVVKLRTFSRLDEADTKTIEVEESIESVLTLLQHKLTDRLQVVRQYGPVKTLSCFPGPLNQVIMNVVSNAIDAIEGEGTITIATEVAGPMFCISIHDTGAGIPDAIKDRIFDPFFTTKPVGAGTGLGLSISYGIVQRHKGQLEIQSEEGLGTKVVIRLPVDS